MTRSVALVIVGMTLDLSRLHRQQRLGTVQRLNLALLVHAQDHADRADAYTGPTMSPTFSISNGSGDNLKVSVRCG